MPNTLSRIERDVLRTFNLDYVTLLQAANEIYAPYYLGRTDQIVRPEPIIGAYRFIGKRLHAHAIKVVLATILPNQSADQFYRACHSDASEAIRRMVNAWIRRQRDFDAVLDFYVVMSAAQVPVSLNPALNSSDHLHPNDAGYGSLRKLSHLHSSNKPISANIDQGLK